MKPSAIRKLIANCRRDDEGLRPTTQYFAAVEIEETKFCLHGELYQKYGKALDPLIGVAERVWGESKGAKFLLFVIKGWDPASALRRKLQSIGSRERRAARVRQAKGHHLKEHYRVLWEIQGGRCYFSGLPLGDNFEDKKFSVDHLYPLAVKSWPYTAPKGTQWPTNLALVSIAVNQGKGGRLPVDYLAEVRRYKRFVPRPATERRKIDQLRLRRFADYMRQHCSEDKADWIPHEF